MRASWSAEGRKNIIIIAVAAASILLLYMLSTAVTGFVAYSEELETNLSDMKTLLSAAISEREKCEQSLVKSGSELSSCQQTAAAAAAEMQRCEEQKSVLSINLEQCSREREEFKGLYNSSAEELKRLAVNAAKDICCRPGIETTAWDIANGTITCSGRHYLNCRTGEAEF